MRHARAAAESTLLLLAGIVLACGGRDRPPGRDPYAVVFAIEAAEAHDPAHVGWLATYEAEGKVARFQIELKPEPAGAGLPAFTRCVLLREEGSDASVLLRDLARALGGRVPQPGPGVRGLDLPAVLLGRDLSYGGGGNRIAGKFGSEPKGTWIATKLFMADGEVFLSLDPVGGFGEFSLKDPEYGSAVLGALGRLLQGDPAADVVTLDEGTGPASTGVAPLPAPTPDPDVEFAAKLAKQAAPGVAQPERRQALERLAQRGPRARSALPVFLKALEDEDLVIRREALLGLPNLRPEPAAGVAAVTPLLNDPHAVNQVLAAEALAKFGETQTAVAYLTVFLKGESSIWAAAALGRIGPEARRAVPLLTEMLESRQSPQAGYAACRALAAIGRDAASALPALREASQDVDKHVREMAAYAIREIEGH
jgi:hypothetical protein